MNIPTIKVKPWGADQGDHVVINAEDFDPAVHTPFEAERGEAPAASRLDPDSKPKAKRSAKRKAK